VQGAWVEIVDTSPGPAPNRLDPVFLYKSLP
jgi:hypothetical protein